MIPRWIHEVVVGPDAAVEDHFLGGAIELGWAGEATRSLTLRLPLGVWLHVEWGNCPGWGVTTRSGRAAHRALVDAQFAAYRAASRRVS